MLVGKQVADLITGMRAFIAFWLAELGLSIGAGGITLAVWLLIADWTGDILDGPIARRSRIYYHTWIGDHDLEVDMLVSAGLLVYMVGAGFVSLGTALTYLLVWALIFWHWGFLRSLGMLAQAPIYGWFIWSAITIVPSAGWSLILWIGAAVVLTWPRFPQEVIPGFLRGMKEMFNRYYSA